MGPMCTLGRLSVRLSTFSKPSEDLVNTVNVVNVVKTNIMMTLVDQQWLVKGRVGGLSYDVTSVTCNLTFSPEKYGTEPVTSVTSVTSETSVTSVTSVT